nr:transposase [Streptomyces sp. DSM 40907]
MWGRIEPPMPADPDRGRRWADHRRTLEAIAWKCRTNSPWRDLSRSASSGTRARITFRWASRTASWSDRRAVCPVTHL